MVTCHDAVLVTDFAFTSAYAVAFVIKYKYLCIEKSTVLLHLLVN